MGVDELPDDEAALLDFLHLCGEDERAGLQRGLADYLARFPGHEALVERAWHSRRERDAPVDFSTRTLGPYRLLRELGRGGQSVVYLAEDSRLPRRVALKVLHSPFDAVSQQRKARLRREAEAIAKLDHPHLCSILEAEFEHDPPYIAMRWIDGETLARHIARGGGEASLARPRDPLQLRRTLQFFERAALALDVAHEAGLVHRDIKPGNLMIDERGEPVIVDFGLARAHGSNDPTLTRAHEAVGTPAYMSPEQLQGPPDNVDRRSDVYALGVSLYECLAARRPFEADGSAELVRAITGAVPPDVRTHNPALPEELAVVLDTALERDLRRRYPTARALAQDLRSILEYRPIAARPAGAWLRLRRWTQRHPALAGVLAVLFFALCVSLYLLRARAIVQRRLLGSSLATMSLSMVEQDPTRALLLAIDAAQIERGFYSDSALIAALAECRERRSLGLPERALDLALAPDSRAVAFACANGEIALFELATGALNGSLRGHAAAVTGVAFSSDGRRLASAAQDSTARLWSTASLACEQVLAGHTAPVRSVAFSPDDRFVVTASEDGTARVWSTETGRSTLELRGHEGVVTGAVFSPDGALVLTVSGPSSGVDVAAASDRTARIWSALDGSAVSVLRGHAAFLRDARFLRGGASVVTASQDGSVRVWTTRSGELEATLGCPGAVHAAAPSPDGEWIAIAHETGARLWRPASGELVELVGHLQGSVRSAEFSGDGRRLVTGADDRTARIWSVPDGRELANLHRANHRVIACRWSADSESVVTTCWNAWAHVWYAGELPGLKVLAGHRAPVRVAQFDAAGQRMLTASDDGAVCAWSELDAVPARREVAAAGRPLRDAGFSASGDIAFALSVAGELSLHPLDPQSAATLSGAGEHAWSGAQLDRRGTRLLAWSSDGAIRVWDTQSGAAPVAFDGAGEHWSGGAIAQDGRVAVCGAQEGTARVWDVERGTPLRDLPRPAVGALDSPGVCAVALAPDGTRVALGYRDRSIGLFELASGRQLARTHVSGALARLTFHDDGRRLLGVLLSNPALVLLDGVDGELLRWIGDSRFDAHAADATCGAFDREARTVATGSFDGSARLWSAADGARRLLCDARAGAVLALAFHPDGSRVATAHADGSVRLWPVDPLPAALARRPREWNEHERASYFGR